MLTQTHKQQQQQLNCIDVTANLRLYIMYSYLLFSSSETLWAAGDHSYTPINTPGIALFQQEFSYIANLYTKQIYALGDNKKEKKSPVRCVPSTPICIMGDFFSSSVKTM